MAEPLSITERDGFALATIMARSGVSAQAIGEAMGTPAPSGPQAAFGAELTLLGTGPGVWLVLKPAGSNDLATELRGRLGALASVSDQSSSYRIHRLAGPGARTVLQRGAPIDLHPSAFRPGDVAVTVIAHLGVIIWQADEAPTYEVAVFRSFAGSFNEWLEAATAAL